MVSDNTAQVEVDLKLKYKDCKDNYVNGLVTIKRDVETETDVEIKKAVKIYLAMWEKTTTVTFNEDGAILAKHDRAAAQLTNVYA